MPVVFQLLHHTPPELGDGEWLHECALVAVTILGGAVDEGRHHLLASLPKVIVHATLAAVERTQMGPKLDVTSDNAGTRNSYLGKSVCMQM